MTTSGYGTWLSPLTSKIACDSSVTIKRMYVDETNDGILYWSEQHPEEGGKTIVYSKKSSMTLEDQATRWTPDEGFDVYNMVHEYGGASFFVGHGILCFSNLKSEQNNVVDTKIYRQTETVKTPVAVTGKSTYFRYADGEFSKSSKFFFCVREQHFLTDEKEAENVIVAVDMETKEETVVASGNNFYSSPRVSPDGTKIAWITWVHPNMPWDKTDLYVTNFTIQSNKILIGENQKISGENGVNYMEPSWTCDNRLMYICDKSGWWNLYVHDYVTGAGAVCVHAVDQEIGGPCWEFGNRSYSTNPKNADEVVTLYGAKPAIISIKDKKIINKEIDIGSRYAMSCVYLPDGEHIFLYVVSPLEPGKILKYNQTSGLLDDFHHSSLPVVEEGYLSGPPVLLEFETQIDDPNEPIKTAYGYWYKPKNKDCENSVSEGELPPALIKVHGGPTSAASLALDLQKQYFTSRGIGIFDLNYRGSTGYGTAFRNSLQGNWGLYDLTDAQKAAEYLVSRGLADAKKILISGGSSGGYTTLACMTFKNDPDPNKRTFTTGASYYGISDLAALAKDTHKFESKYCDVMIAPYDKQEQVYHDRSPYPEHIEQFLTPCAFFQGMLDEVVPWKQSYNMYKQLKENGIICSFVGFENEYHGFKISENKQKALDGEFYFYSVLLNFEPADEGIEIPIDNLPEDKLKKK